MSQQKGPNFEKVLFLEYKSSSIDNCLVLFPIFLIKFSNLRGFDESFPLIEMEKFSSENAFESLQIGWKQQVGFRFGLLLSNDDTWMCSC